MAEKKPCREPGCRMLTDGAARCPEHEAECQARRKLLRDRQPSPWADPDFRRRDVERRGSSEDRGYDGKWRGLRNRYLRANPLCEKCALRGRETLATMVDHREPHRGDEALRLSPANLQSLCTACHNAKTRTEGPGYRAPRM